MFYVIVRFTLTLIEFFSLIPKSSQQLCIKDKQHSSDSIAIDQRQLSFLFSTKLRIFITIESACQHPHQNKHTNYAPIFYSSKETVWSFSQSPPHNDHSIFQDYHY